MKNNKVFTKTNIIVTIITIAVFLFKFIELIIMAENAGSYTTYDDIAFAFLMFMIYTIIWAYLTRVVGINKGIENGYAWGYCLGIIGFIVVCVLQGENTKEQTSNSSKYEDLEKLQKLKESGAITDVEFEIEKQKLLR